MLKARMLGQLQYEKQGGAIASPKSAYQPGELVRELTLEVMDAFKDGEAVKTAPYQEYNGKSFVDMANDCQRTWLAHPDAPYEGDEDWRFNGVRPLTRNRVISTAAHLTSQILYPKSFAQNPDQEEDRDASYVMDSLIEYNIRRSNYETAFLFGVIAGLVNPINFIKVEYCEAWQEAWREEKYERVIDDILSGFQFSLVPTDEILFGNAYVYEWQRQDWIIQSRRISYEEAEGKHGDHENWGHVAQGKLCMYADDGYVYEVVDINDGLVGEVCYKHRRTDREIYFVNGVYLSNPNTAYNPFYHRTNKDMPKYDTVKYGFEPVDAMRFIGYKSLVDKMQNDQDAADREWQMYFDASYVSTFMPIVTMGADKIDRSVVAPSSVTDIGKDAKIQPLQIVNPSTALAALREAERSATETSLDPQGSGIQEGPQKTKGEALLLQQNMDTNLGLSAKMIAAMVKDVGRLFVDDIIRYQTIGEAGEIVGQMAYRTFVVDNRIREGKNKTTYIKFTDRFAGEPMTPEEKKMEEYRMLSEAGDSRELVEVNPGVFSRLDFLVTIDADQLLRRNDAFERAFKLQAYDKAIADSLIQQDPEAHLKILRDFLLEPVMKGSASRYLPRIQKVASQVVPNGGNTPPNRYPQDNLAARTVANAAGSGVVS